MAFLKKKCVICANLPVRNVVFDIRSQAYIASFLALCLTRRLSLFAILTKRSKILPCNRCGTVAILVRQPHPTPPHSDRRRFPMLCDTIDYRQYVRDCCQVRLTLHSYIQTEYFECHIMSMGGMTRHASVSTFVDLHVHTHHLHAVCGRDGGGPQASPKRAQAGNLRQGKPLDIKLARVTFSTCGVQPSRTAHD